VSDVVVEVAWMDGLRFEGRGRNQVPIVLDGAGLAGPAPTEALLMGVAACMGIDVVDMLAKMRVPVEALTVRAEGDRRAEPPRRYTAIRLVYAARGVPESSAGKLQRAVELSRTKYCSVLHSLDPEVDVDIRIEAA
jgi:putative redox protein